MDTWDYLILKSTAEETTLMTVTTNANLPDTSTGKEALVSTGEAGWELVAVVPREAVNPFNEQVEHCSFLYFKRPKVQDSK